MPIYEYVCRKCGKKFEHLARGLNEAPPDCPKCGASRPDKQLSVFSAGRAAEPESACTACSKAGSCPMASGHE